MGWKLKGLRGRNILSKNNNLQKQMKVEEKVNRFSIRKLSVGVTSVLLGTVMWMGANGQLVHADVVNSSQSNVVDNEMRENSVQLSKVSQVQDNNQSSVSSPQNSKSSNNTAASQKTITNAADNLDKAVSAAQAAHVNVKQDGTKTVIGNDSQDAADQVKNDYDQQVPKLNDATEKQAAVSKEYTDKVNKIANSIKDQVNNGGLDVKQNNQQGLKLGDETNATITVDANNNAKVTTINGPYNGKNNKMIQWPDANPNNEVTVTYSNLTNSSYVDIYGAGE